jgi:hypothetical protein
VRHRYKHVSSTTVLQYHSTAFLELQQQVTDEAGNTLADGKGVGKPTFSFSENHEWFQNEMENTVVIE